MIGSDDVERGLVRQKSKVREAKYWYDVPLAAIPVREEGWPEKPDSMNGRQYFLWWQTSFKTNDDPEKGELGMPVILDPLPERKDVKYMMGGNSSRMWGA
jgi:hypothetical protein